MVSRSVKQFVKYCNPLYMPLYVKGSCLSVKGFIHGPRV